MTTALSPAAAHEPMALIQLALEKGASPDHLSKLLDLQERIERSRAEEAFGNAIAAFQSELKPILKTRVVKNRDQRTERYRFASYDDIYEAVGPILQKCGISISFSVPATEERFNMVLRLRVGSYYEDKQYSAPTPDFEALAKQLYMTQPQAFGVALSYHKRYCLCAALNIVVTDEDPDAASLTNPISDDQVAELRNLCAEANKSESGVCKWLGIESFEECVKSDYDKAVFQLKTWIAEKGGTRR